MPRFCAVSPLIFNRLTLLPLKRVHSSFKSHIIPSSSRQVGSSGQSSASFSDPLTRPGTNASVMTPRLDGYFQQCVLPLSQEILSRTVQEEKLTSVVSLSVDNLADSFIERSLPPTSAFVRLNHTENSLGLRKAVAIPSVSADEERRQDVVKVGLWRHPSWSHH